MISVLASIRPFWCKKILILEKSVELRKTYPRAACGLPWWENSFAGLSSTLPADRIKLALCKAAA